MCNHGMSPFIKHLNSAVRKAADSRQGYDDSARLEIDLDAINAFPGKSLDDVAKHRQAIEDELITEGILTVN